MYVSSANFIDHTYYNVQNNLQQMKLELLYFLLISCQIDHLKNLLYSVI